MRKRKREEMRKGTKCRLQKMKHDMMMTAFENEYQKSDAKCFFPMIEQKMYQKLASGKIW